MSLLQIQLNMRIISVIATNEAEDTQLNQNKLLFKYLNNKKH